MLKAGSRGVKSSRIPVAVALSSIRRSSRNQLTNVSAHCKRTLHYKDMQFACQGKTLRNFKRLR